MTRRMTRKTMSSPCIARPTVLDLILSLFKVRVNQRIEIITVRLSHYVL